MEKKKRDLQVWARHTQPSYENKGLLQKIEQNHVCTIHTHSNKLPYYEQTGTCLIFCCCVGGM